jgi:hypothetical protein
MFGSHLVESCPQCKTTNGTTFVPEDAHGDDCNGRAALTDYREHQQGENPHRCSCGTKLVPSVTV